MAAFSEVPEYLQVKEEVFKDAWRKAYYFKELKLLVQGLVPTKMVQSETQPEPLRTGVGISFTGMTKISTTISGQASGASPQSPRRRTSSATLDAISSSPLLRPLKRRSV